MIKSRNKGRSDTFDIEKQFQKRVLIGNWYEERLEFDKPEYRHNSTYRRDYPKSHVPSEWDCQSGAAACQGAEGSSAAQGGAGCPAARQTSTSAITDKIVRRPLKYKNEGILDRFTFFRHHGHQYDQPYITWYDEHYNRNGENKFPRLRHFDSTVMEWAPEKSDHPLQGAATNHGLREGLANQWATEQSQQAGHYQTVYRSDYIPKPIQRRRAFVRSDGLLDIGRGGELRTVPVVTEPSSSRLRSHLSPSGTKCSLPGIPTTSGHLVFQT